MISPQTLLLAVPIALLLVIAAVPSGIANRFVIPMRRLVTFFAGFAFLAAVLSAGWAGVSGAWNAVVIRWAETVPISISLHYDGVAALMLALVSFVGLVVCRFSIRYLDGEATQGRYFRWIALTIGAVSLMVVSGNLLLFFLAWVMTSFGLHQLLLHYPHRPAAQRAAWTKFTISRIGDAFLIAALILIYNTFGTFELSELFATLGNASSAPMQSTTALTWIGWLLVLGAVTKSAQFPFHTWLPETMETPTPVSALMHAGIVNAGGYLVIRMSPLVTQAPAALTTLAVIGTVTACFAGVVMMTQPSVKRALAYSTIAQMGFMMLQCGLGAFSAAMLHILAHSLYKAHAFLSSGSVVSQGLSTNGSMVAAPKPRTSFLYLLGATAATISAYFAISAVLGLDHASKPGGIVLGFVLCLALTTWGWRVFTAGTPRTTAVGLVALAGLSLVYVASYLAVQKVLGSAVPMFAMSPAALVVAGCVALAFCLLFGLHATVTKSRQPKWLEAFWVHASNGFYVDIVLRRMFKSLATS